MKTIWLTPVLPVGLLFAAAFLYAQEKSSAVPPTAASINSYDVDREVTLVGTVVAYSSNSKTAPGGPRVSLQTPSGVIDIHLGDARLLAANQFTLQPGDTLRIVGENISYSGGTQFVARIVQKGAQALLLRNTRGIPIISNSPRGSAVSARQGSVL